VLVVGDNAQGKTSLLEAVFYLATFSSFHASSDRQLINLLIAQDALSVARIVAEYWRGGRTHRLEVRVILDAVGPSGRRVRKEVLVDGVKRGVGQAVGNFLAVLFLPQMMQIIEGGPEERRRYLNLALAQVVPGYAEALSNYQQALQQRNALLKLLAERGGPVEQLEYWDGLLAQYGATILLARLNAVQEMERLAARIHLRLTRNQEVLRWIYQPAYDPLPQPEGQYKLAIQTPVQRTGFTYEQLRRGFVERLLALRNEEIGRGVTTIGPHRDELRFWSNGLDLGEFGSRGQVRTALLSAKLAEAAWMREKTGEWPVMLLDETLAELDVQRRADLLESQDEVQQVLMTTTDLKLFPEEFVHSSRVWWVKDGCVTTTD
jgi:DNA replication and repair protein RecF